MSRALGNNKEPTLHPGLFGLRLQGGNCPTCCKSERQSKNSYLVEQSSGGWLSVSRRGRKWESWQQHRESTCRKEEWSTTHTHTHTFSPLQVGLPASVWVHSTSNSFLRSPLLAAAPVLSSHFTCSELLAPSSRSSPALLRLIYSPADTLPHKCALSSHSHAEDFTAVHSLDKAGGSYAASHFLRLVPSLNTEPEP